MRRHAGVTGAGQASLTFVMVLSRRHVCRRQAVRSASFPLLGHASLSHFPALFRPMLDELHSDPPPSLASKRARKIRNAPCHAPGYPSGRMASRKSFVELFGGLDWARLTVDLSTRGNAVAERVLTVGQCRALAAMYAQDAAFRSRVIMSRHGFGRGEYKYFTYPLPAAVSELRAALYPHLAPIANDWNKKLGIDVEYPRTHDVFLKRCHQAGQTRPTPLLLQYEQDDYNCLHQDIYGEHIFPLQIAILLSAPERDFTGGEFVMTEQRPRMQTRPEVVPLKQGDGVIFAVRERPVQGTRGIYRVNLRHGVSRVRSGHRHTLGVIFHDAR